MQSKLFRNKTTGEIVTQVPIHEIANYEECCNGVHDTVNDIIKCEHCASMLDNM